MKPIIQGLCLSLLLISPLAMALEEASSPAKPCPLKALKDGHEISWSSLKGKVVYLDFWASWCGPCAQSFPFMAEMAQSHRKDGLETMPTSYLIDRKGQLRHVHRGFSRADQTRLSETIVGLLKEKP